MYETKFLMYLLQKVLFSPLHSLSQQNTCRFPILINIDINMHLDLYLPHLISRITSIQTLTLHFHDRSIPSLGSPALLLLFSTSVAILTFPSIHQPRKHVHRAVYARQQSTTHAKAKLTAQEANISAWPAQNLWMLGFNCSAHTPRPQEEKSSG